MSSATRPNPVDSHRIEQRWLETRGCGRKIAAYYATNVGGFARWSSCPYALA